LALASKTLITRKKPKNVFDFPLVFEFCTCERMLSLLLVGIFGNHSRHFFN